MGKNTCRPIEEHFGYFWRKTKNEEINKCILNVKRKFVLILYFRNFIEDCVLLQKLECGNANLIERHACEFCMKFVFIWSFSSYKTKTFLCEKIYFIHFSNKTLNFRIYSWMKKNPIYYHTCIANFICPITEWLKTSTPIILIIFSYIEHLKTSKREKRTKSLSILSVPLLYFAHSHEYKWVALARPTNLFIFLSI